MKSLIQLIENYLASSLTDMSMPERLRNAMNYSLLAGGKRLRPCLCLLCAGATLSSSYPVSNEKDSLAFYNKILPFACSLEMIHTYSLIHDDLPAMDDDDLRRGRPSNHKAFDEATAILAGDALLTDAFWFMSQVKDVKPVQLLRAISIVSEAAGARGMVGGQVLDMLYTGIVPQFGNKTQLEQIQAMQAGKTGALFRASCVSGAILAEATDEQIQCFTSFAEAFGLEFQIVDDILDVTQDTATLGKPAGSDAEQGKLTWVNLMSLDEARNRACMEAQRASNALISFDGRDAEILRSLALNLVDRIN